MNPNKVESIELSTLQIPPKRPWKNRPSGWSILWTRRGGIVLQDESHVHVTKPGHVAIVPPGVSASLQADGHPVVGHELWFNPEGLACLIASPTTRTFFQRPSRTGAGIILLPKGNSLTPLLQALTEPQPPHHHTKRGRAQKAMQPMSCPCSFMLQVGAVLDALKAIVARPEEGTGDAGRKVMAVLDHLTAPELQELNVDKLAQRCGFSRRHLARLVKGQCGSSLAALVAQTRLDKAAELLRDPATKVVNVAMDCGFKHLGAFSAKFRARFGMTPSDWRKDGNGRH